MNLAMIGSGYVGLVSAACFAEFGHKVVCVDQDRSKIERLKDGEIPIFEPGLADLITRNAAAGRLHFTVDVEEAVPVSDVVLIAVGTPSRRGDGHADLSHVFNATRQIGAAMTDYTVVVTKSTVPVGTGREVARILEQSNRAAEFDVASNPEFLREGSAIEDFMRPNRVVVGTSSPRARAVMQELYRPLSLNETPILFSDVETAETIKYAANAFLAMKITFINQIADLCEKIGADVQLVAKGIGLDNRIGPKFLHPGPGYGGSCFPKDTRALLEISRQAGVGLSLVEATVAFNDRRKLAMVDRIMGTLGNSTGDRTVAVLGLTFKPNTDDVRELPSLTIVPELLCRGVRVRAHDPEGASEAARLIPGLECFDDPYQAIAGADALVILTEWNCYRALDLARVRSSLKTPCILDFRNIYRLEEMRDAGIFYQSLGRPAEGSMPKSGTIH